MREADYQMEEPVLDELLLTRITVDKAPDPVLWIGADARILYGNEAARRRFGYSREELLALRIPDLDPNFPREKEAIARRWREIVALGSQTFETCVRTAEGTLIPVEVTSHHVSHAGGELCVSTVRDLSCRREAEERLRGSEERLRLATRSGRIGVWEYEPAVDRLEWDDLMYEIYGMERSGAPGGIHRWLQRVHPEDLKATEESFRRSLEDGRRNFDLEFRILRGDDGSVRHIRGIATCVRDERGRAVRAIGTNRDITESRKAVAALLESEERFRNVIEQSNDAIYILYENRFDLVNRRFCELTGVTPEESKAPDFSFWSLVDPESLPLIRERRERRARGERVPSVYNFVVRGRDGGQVQVEASVTEIDYRGGKAVLGILRDNSEQKRLEEQLRQSQKLESIGRLSGGVAHDLNNLLSPILGYGEMLLEDFGKEDRRREMAEEIVAAAGRARDLIRQLLAFSRKQTLAFRPVELNALITNFRKLLRRTIRENVHLELALTPHLPPVRADLGQLEQVLMNLAVNAEEAMPAGGRLTIETALADLDEDYAATRPGVKPGRYVLLALSDTGVGMDAKTQGMVFEPFFTTKKKGTGLGLATVYGIVKQHGGNIWVYSEPGRGTTFKCYLPALEGEATRIEKEPEPRGEETPVSGTIMVVEDESTVRHMVEAVLRRHGYTVLSAADGEDCLELLAKHEGHLDLVLTDVVLPGVNGRDLVEAVRERFPSVRALFMSGYTEEVITKHGVLEEGITFIQKPFSVRQLTARVREALGKR